jgi:predicted GNAT family acetyltransferase
MLKNGLRPPLFADPFDRTADGIYRRVGYETATEMTRYGFGN